MDQLIYYIVFMFIMTVIIFTLHFLRTKTYDGPFMMMISFLWFISFVAGHLGYKVVVQLGLIQLDIRYSSSIWFLVFMSVLLVYICEGIHETQNVIMLSVGIQFLIGVTTFFFGDLLFPLLTQLNDHQFEVAAKVIFEPFYWRIGVSIFAIVIDLFFAVFFFQFLVNHLKKVPTGVLIFIAMIFTMVIDSLIFVGATRMDTFWTTLRSHLVFKSVLIAMITVPFSLYIWWFQKRGNLDLRRGSLDIFTRIDSLEEALTKANQDLREYANTLEQKVEERTETLRHTNENLQTTIKKLDDAQKIAEKDMEMAINVQSNLLPKKLNDNTEWDVAYCFQPMSGVSGDFYDFYEIGGRLHGVGLFDVSGHGISSGLITVLSRSIIFREFKRGLLSRLNDVIQNINEELIKEIGDTGNYLTGVLLRFDDDQVEYVNAGHTDLLYKRSKNGQVAIVESKDTVWRGWFLGIEAMRTEFKVLKLKVAPGDYLITFSDCLIEAKNVHGEQFGLGRIMDIVRATDDVSAQELLDAIHREFSEFVGDQAIDDDLTALVLKRK